VEIDYARVMSVSQNIYNILKETRLKWEKINTLSNDSSMDKTDSIIEINKIEKVFERALFGSTDEKVEIKI
jgi:hypothetical protein